MEQQVKVHILFPVNSSLAETEIFLPYDELMLILQCGECYLKDFKDEDELNPFYKVERAIRVFSEDSETNEVTLWLEYAQDHKNI